MTNERKISELQEKRRLKQVDEKNKQTLQKLKGKLTARERIEYLLDDRSFAELFSFYSTGDDIKNNGVIVGYGTIEGRLVYLYSQDVTEFSGALANENLKKIRDIFALAVKTGTPVIGLIECEGTKLDEGISVLNSIGELIKSQVEVSGVIPQICAILGNCYGIMNYCAAMNDFICIVDKESKMLTNSVATMTLDDDIREDFVNVAHFINNTEQECLDNIKKLITFLPDNNLSDAEVVESDDLNKISESLNYVFDKDNFDIHEIITEIIDNNDFLEIQKDFAKNMIIGLARIGGRTIGIVANNEADKAGIIDIDASEKAARFIRFCDAFNIPLITLIDSQGYVSSVSQEFSGLLKRGAKLLYAYAEATVPKINVIVRKSYGAGYVAMGSIGKDITLAWPTAEVGIAVPEVASSILYRDRIKAGESREKLAEEYREKEANVYVASQGGYIDEIIEPKFTRQRIISALYLLMAKRENRPVKKHGNIVL